MWHVAKVRDVVKRPLITVDGNASVTEAAKIMADHRISGVVVTERGEPKGLITERDLVTKVLAAGRNPDKTKAGEVMSSPLITVDIESTLLEAVDLMNRKKVRRLIVTENDVVVGLFTIRDVISLSRVCSYCGKPIKPRLPSQPASEADVVVECGCGAVYMMECAKTVVYCIFCSGKLVAEVYYPAPEDTFSG
ncbi:MAG: CBS domain-containing protein [Candidatus Caldarchaeum sp.]|nr:CBS domain-containing protein [Candidatus Caldarchaeum sp.]MDW8062556.1 CBS domain-containing protein [Candidatus Caldarchaeum sp.]MDW8435839.1 CBS domain-containing protein [Candidatus Caldarchaeum sp.]